jgi:putative FmdB family regulatory protein
VSASERHRRSPLPTYEYACKACGHELEAVQKFTDEPLTECPECHGALRKVYGAVGIVLKGSGFYKTDSRAASGARNGNGKDAKKKDTESSSSESSSSSSDSKDSSSSSSSSTPKSDGGSKDSKPAAAAAS